jgi:PleD family two-component response regulator
MTTRVLVVDDVAANVKMLEARLSAEYFDVVTAMSGKEALAICERAKCDIVLLDVMMPRHGRFRGLSAAQGWPEDPPHSDRHGHCARPAVRSPAGPAGRGRRFSHQARLRRGDDRPRALAAVATMVAERLRRRITSESFQVQQGTRNIEVTISIGIAGLGAGDTASGVLKRADQALYRAKRDGRNRAVPDAA